MGRSRIMYGKRGCDFCGKLVTTGPAIAIHHRSSRCQVYFQAGYRRTVAQGLVAFFRWLGHSRVQSLQGRG